MLPTSPYSHLTRDELIEMLEQPEQGVRITFSGKATSRQIARNVRPRVMRRLPKYSTGPAEVQAENRVIEGENLQGMVSLYRYRGQVDLVLTDPPYNTGNDFRYNERWDEDPNDPNLGEIVTADDRARHTKWMRFMWPRLQIMRSMLKPHGVLAICIDHRELFRLGSMLDEIFGEQNRIAIINWQKNYSPKNNVGERTHVSTATEYVLVYANNIEVAKTRLLDRTDRMNARYRNPDDDPRLWKGADLSGPGGFELVEARRGEADEAHQLADAEDAATTLDEHDQVDRISDHRRNDGLLRKTDQHFQSRQRLAWAVRVDGRERALVARVQGHEKVECRRVSALADDDAIGAQA